MASYPTQPGMKFPVELADVGLRVDDQGRYVSGDSFNFRLVSDQIPGYSIISIAGHNDAVAQAYVPIVDGGFWQTPQVADVSTLRIAAGDANDTALGTGAREVTLRGMDATGVSITEVLATNGILASASTTQSFIRLLAARVTASGTYSSLTADSHAAEIVIESSDGLLQWGTIPFTGILAHSRSKIGCVTVPLGKKAWVAFIAIGIDSAKSTDVSLFSRAGILDEVAPFLPFQIEQEVVGAGGINQFEGNFPLGPFNALTDLGMIAKVSQATATISSVLSIIVVDETLL